MSSFSATQRPPMLHYHVHVVEPDGTRRTGAYATDPRAAAAEAQIEEECEPIDCGSGKRRATVVKCKARDLMCLAGEG